MQLNNSASQTSTVLVSSRNGRPFRIGVIALTGLTGIMFVTNPSQKDYAAYATEQLASHLQENYCQGAKLPEWASSVGSFVQDVCKTALAGGDTLISTDQKRTFIQNLTKQQDFHLFSIYTTKLPLEKPFTVVGVFGHFIPCPTNLLGKE